MDQFGLRLKLYIVNCPKHPLDDDEDYFAKNPEYGDEVQVISDMYKYLSYSSRQGGVSDIYLDLMQTKCIGYSCVMVMINTDCDCRSKMLLKVLKAMKKNTNLRYKSKLIMATYHKKARFRNIWERDMSEVFFEKFFLNLKKSSIGFASGLMLHPSLNTSYGGKQKNPFKSLQKIMKPKIFGEPATTNWSKKLNSDQIKNITRDDRNPVNDHYLFNEMKLDNAIFMQCFTNREEDRGFEVDTIMFQIYKTPLKTMQEVLSRNVEIMGYFRIIQTSTNADFYFYSINPALAIIANGYYFNTDHELREGSEQDVTRLTRELKIAGIPYLLIQDCSRDELLQIIDYVEREDFSPLKSFFFFLMSHGHSNNTIYTRDDQIDLQKDIVTRLQSNATLNEAELLVVANACRGKFDAEHIEDDEEIPITKTDSQYLKENTVVMYSVPESLTSPRHHVDGSPFIKRFCKHFRNVNHGDGIRSFKNGIDKDLANTDDYYCYLENPTELVAKDAGKDHYIVKKPIKARSMIKLIETIMNKFPHFGDLDKDDDGPAPKTMFYVNGILSRTGESIDEMRETFADKYFAPQLDCDDCPVDNVN